MTDLTTDEISMSKLTKFSRFLSYLLRHRPDEINLTMDSQGWVSVNELITNLEKEQKYKVNLDILKEIVDTDDKQRYSFKDDFKYIRANQGHSIDLDINFKEYKPSGVLYHGTATRFVDDIFDSGLKPMTRQYVHLSKDIETAEKVGSRHGNPIILVVDAVSMVSDGFKFYESDNGVVLIKEVPKKYISLQ